jgi:hypothetical protein
MSDLKEQLKEALREAAMGDETSIDALAGFLEDGQGQARESEAQQVNAHWDSKWKFRGKVDALKKEFPVLDPYEDLEGWELTSKIDQQILAMYPDMAEEDRVRMAAERATKRMGDPHSRDYGSAIARMRNSRMVPALRETPNEEFRYEPPNEDVDSMIERDRSELIAQMSRERGPRPGPELSEDQRQKIRRSRASGG